MVGLLRAFAWRQDHTLWTDRDLWRADRLFLDWPTAGAELSWGEGARVPGGAWYLWLGLGRALGFDAAALFQHLLLLDVVAVGAVGWLAWRAGGPVAGAVAALLYVGPTEAREAMRWLWNPTPAPTLVALSLVLLAEGLRTRRAGWFAGWAAVGGLAAQLHLSALAWVGWSVVSLLWVDRAGARRWLPAALAGLGVVYLPYAVGEWASGGENGRLMAVQGPVLAAQSGGFFAVQWEELPRAFGYFSPRVSDGADGAALVVFVALAAAGVAAAWSRDGAPWVRALCLPALAVTVTPCLSHNIVLEDRYVVVALPAWSVLAGYGAAALGRRWTGVGWGAMAAAAAPALVLAATLSTQGWEGDDNRADWPTHTLRALLTDLTGPDRPTRSDVAGRTVFLQPDGPDGWRVTPLPVESLLAEVGEEFPGSLAPPCLAVSRQGAPDAASLGRALKVVVEAVEPVEAGGGAVVVAYRVAGESRCRTSMYNRYVDSAAEAELRGVWRSTPPGRAIALPGEAPTARRAGALRSAAGGFVELAVLAELTPRAGGLRGVLHLPQLGGTASNNGWFQTAMADQVALTLEGAGGVRVDVALSDAPIGASGIVAPLRFDADVPPGTWAVTLSARPWSLDGGGAWQPSGQALRLRLEDALVVP
jgi:hypothetical protein